MDSRKRPHSATEDSKASGGGSGSKSKLKSAKKCAVVDSFKEFSANAAKQLKAHCGAGRLDKARALLEKHGYGTPGCIQENDASKASANLDLLLDCTQNAARMGHLEKQTEVIDMLLDLGVVPNFQVMYWVTISCCVPTLERCAALCMNTTDDEGAPNDLLLEKVAAHALKRKMAGNFLHLMNNCGIRLPMWLTSVQGFIEIAQPNSSVYFDPNSDESDDGELLDSVRTAVLTSWAAQGVLEGAVEECRRLRAIAVEHGGEESADKYDVAIQFLQQHEEANRDGDK